MSHDKKWLLTAAEDGRRVTLNSFDFEFEAWSARSLVLATVPGLKDLRVVLNPAHLEAPLVKRPTAPLPVSHWHEMVRAESQRLQRS